ncbi:MAG: XdhC/CoxI family protein [Bacillota bacterium]|nr:XdhC/CoxI family protein [Bacillota bacterium]
MSFYREISSLLKEGKPSVLVTVISSDKNYDLIGKQLVISEGKILYSNVNQMLAEVIYQIVSPIAEGGENFTLKTELPSGDQIEVFIHAYSPHPRLIILGGGHIGAALCRIASNLDFEIILIDDRPAFASRELHPHAHRLICEHFGDALDSIESTFADYIVIVTRGHKHDRYCLEKSLGRKAAYIGMIGSKSRVRAQLNELRELGYTEEELSRVHSPIGLPIGAVSEGEIAISILAEIIQERRSTSSDEAIQQDILQELVRIEEDKQKAALVTLVKTLGSTPRKTGSQLLIFPDGSLKGTIGGGCSEAGVRQEALTRLDHQEQGVMRLDLTGDVAADEGMACGGIMEIFIELLP